MSSMILTSYSEALKIFCNAICNFEFKWHSYGSLLNVFRFMK